MKWYDCFGRVIAVGDDVIICVNNKLYSGIVHQFDNDVLELSYITWDDDLRIEKVIRKRIKYPRGFEGIHGRLRNIYILERK